MGLFDEASEARSQKKAARERLKSLKLEDFSDDLFSFALNNKLRIIGLRLDDHFHVLWYDSEHLVYLSVKKHT